MFVLEKLYGVKTKTIVADFSKGQSVFRTIEKQLQDTQVGILGKRYLE